MRGIYIIIDNIVVFVGIKIFVIVRVYNKVGFYNIVILDLIIVSFDFVIEVLDGKGEKDVDYQSDFYVI